VDPYVLFLVLLVFGVPASLAGFLALCFDARVLDLPGFFYACFGVSTAATLGMIAILSLRGGGFLLVLFGLHGGVYALFFCLSLSRICGTLRGRWAESKIPVKPFEPALLAERQGKLPLAAQMYKDYCRENEADDEALRHYAACLVKLSRHREAVAVLRRAFAVTKGRQQMSIGMEIAYILEARMGDAASARAYLEKLKGLYFHTGLEDEFKDQFKRLRVRVTGDPRPFEEKIDLA
jgi:hypothetical protein